MTESLEVRSALEIWLTGSERTLERLELLIRHWCEVYARDDTYTSEALADAKRLAERHVRESSSATKAGRETPDSMKAAPDAHRGKA